MTRPMKPEPSEVGGENKPSPQQLQQMHFHSICHSNQDLFAHKNKEYGNAFEIYGVLGVVCEILGAVARLPQLVLWAADHGKSKEESIVNVLMDLHNFANMALMCLEKDNWDGRKK